MKTDTETKTVEKDALTVRRVDGDFRAAYQAKSKLVEREKEDFLYALGEQWSEEDRTTLEKAKIKNSNMCNSLVKSFIEGYCYGN